MTTALFLALVFSGAPGVELRASIDGKKPEAGWAYARLGQVVTLHALVRGSTAKQVRWFKVEPTVGAVDNTTPFFHFEPVSYVETPLPACDDRLECPGDVTPTRLPPVAALPGVGTMAFKVRVTLADGRTVETPGLESTKWGGLTKDVFRVVVRRDDTLVGYATELINTPYIFGSAGPDGRNQSDLLIGSDCADLVIYGRRRSGKKAEYTSSYGIDQQAKPLKPGAAVREGDVIHFPGTRHVALLYEDKEPTGVLNAEDLIFHTCWAPPTVQPLGETNCASEPMRVLRFPD
jgi:cell wall-associated NlpC family hydrolase